jgi:hypothetical protein
MSTTETSTPSESITIIRRLNGSYISLEGEWGSYGSRGRGLRFTERGAARAGAVVGYIAALAETNHPLAEPMAEDFIKWFDHLSNFGGVLTHEDSPDLVDEQVPVPAFVVELHDDGTKHGFAVGWFRVQERWGYGSKFTDENQERRSRIEGHYPSYRYQFAFNGGLLYHGPGRGETFAVSLSTPGTQQTFWSTHT